MESGYPGLLASSPSNVPLSVPIRFLLLEEEPCYLWRWVQTGPIERCRVEVPHVLMRQFMMSSAEPRKANQEQRSWWRPRQKRLSSQHAPVKVQLAGRASQRLSRASKLLATDMFGFLHTFRLITRPLQLSDLQLLV